jgi:hypothetical protein
VISPLLCVAVLQLTHTRTRATHTHRHHFVAGSHDLRHLCRLGRNRVHTPSLVSPRSSPLQHHLTHVVLRNELALTHSLVRPAPLHPATPLTVHWTKWRSCGRQCQAASSLSAHRRIRCSSHTCCLRSSCPPLHRLDTWTGRGCVGGSPPFTLSHAPIRSTAHRLRAPTR